MIPFSRSIRYAASLALLAIGTGACADQPTWPPPPTSTPNAALAGLSLGDASVTTFVYSPRLGVTQQLGPHKIVMPANSVCQLSSSYGITEWDQPCVPAEHDIVITATTWTTASGHPQVDFQPSMRFVPTTDSRRFVKLFFRDREADDAALASQLRIDWVPYVGATPVDEAATDPTLRTMVMNGQAWRRIKHFSGYMVAGRTGFASDETTASEGF